MCIAFSDWHWNQSGGNWGRGCWWGELELEHMEIMIEIEGNV
jgi:hypothetical protein